MPTPSDESAPAPQDRVPFLLGQLGTLGVRGLKARLEPHGLHPRQSAVLTTLATSNGVSSSDLSEILSMHRSAVVALVDDLEERGLLTRGRSEDDRRLHDLQITESGRDAVKVARAVSKEFESEFLSALTSKEIVELRKLLQQLAEAHGVLR